MAYNILTTTMYPWFPGLTEIHGDALKLGNYMHDRLAERIRASRFAAEVSKPTLSFIGLSIRSERYRILMKLSKVRLRERKPYCGNHPGPCLGGQPKRKLRYLEWDDWVEFHELVNDELDRKGEWEAWTNPQDQLSRGKNFYVRRWNMRRLHYSWHEPAGQMPGFGNPLRIWNYGELSEFQAGEPDSCECSRCALETRRQQEVDRLIAEDDPFIYDVAANLGKKLDNVKHLIVFRREVLRARFHGGV